MFKIFATAYIIGGLLVAYQIGYVAGRDLGSNPSAVENVFFPTEKFQIYA